MSENSINSVYSEKDAHNFIKKIPSLQQGLATTDLVFVFDCFYGEGIATLCEALLPTSPYIVLVNTYPDKLFRKARETVFHTLYQTYKRIFTLDFFSTTTSYQKKECPYESHKMADIVAQMKESFCSLIDFFIPQSFEFIYYSYYSSKHIKRYTALKQELYAYVHTAGRNYLTRHFFGSRWLKNIGRNLQRITHHHTRDAIRGAINFSDSAIYAPVITGIPFVVGAGPSLNDEIAHVIRTYRNKIVLFCADSALPFLYSHRIVPDVCCIVESQPANLEDFLLPFMSSNISSWSPSTCLQKPADLPIQKTHYIVDLSAHPSTIDAILLLQQRYDVIAEVHMFFSHFVSHSFFEKECVRASRLPALGSVGILALYLATMSSKQSRTKKRNSSIFYSGLDFSYPVGLSHAHMTGGHRHYLLRNTKLTNLVSVSQHRTMHKKNDRILISDPTLVSYARMVESIQKNNTDVQFHDSNEYPLTNEAEPMCISTFARMCESSDIATCSFSRSQPYPDPFLDFDKTKSTFLHAIHEELDALHPSRPTLTQYSRERHTNTLATKAQNAKIGETHTHTNTQKNIQKLDKSATSIPSIPFDKPYSLSMLSLGTYLKPYQLYNPTALSDIAKKRMQLLGKHLLTLCT